MRRLLLAALLALSAASAHAQVARIVISCGSLAPFGAQPAGGTAYVTMDINGNLCTNATGGTGGGGGPVTLLHASTTALGPSLVAKASTGLLHNYNCTAITGGAAGYCVAYNGSAVPAAGALTGANVLDFCYFDTTPRGCSLARAPNPIGYSTGIVLLVTSAASPYTYTTGTDTAALSADFQ